MFSPEAQSLSNGLLRAVIDAEPAHQGDAAATLAAASATRERLICQLTDQHGYDESKIIVDDALELSQRLVDVLARHFGVQLPHPPAA